MLSGQFFSVFCGLFEAMTSFIFKKKIIEDSTRAHEILFFKNILQCILQSFNHFVFVVSIKRENCDRIGHADKTQIDRQLKVLQF